MDEKEKELRSSSEILSFERSLDINEATYTLTGKRLFFNSENENAWEGSDFITYDYYQKSIIRSDKKVVVLQSMISPTSSYKSVSQKILESFKLD